MSDEDRDPKPSLPRLTERARREAEERKRRQGAALRANLARRKAQDRAREDADPPGDNSCEGLENKG